MKNKRKNFTKQFLIFVMALTLCITSFGTSKVNATENNENLEGNGETVSITIDNSASPLAVRFYPDTNDMDNFDVVGPGYTNTFTVSTGNVARIRLYVQADGHFIPEDYAIDGATRLINDDRINFGWCRAAFTIAADETKTLVIPETPVCTHPYANPDVRWGYYDCGDGTHAQSCTLCATDIEGTSANHVLSEMTPTEYANWYYEDSNFANMTEENKASYKASLIEAINKELGVDANTTIKCCTVCEHFEKIEDSTTPEEPSEKPEDSSENTEEPSEKPEDSSENTEEPSEKPEDSSENTEEPSEKPEEPSEKPEEPSEKPEEPSEKPEEPSEKPEEPSEKPEEPSEKPEEPKIETSLSDVNGVLPEGATITTVSLTSGEVYEKATTVVKQKIDGLGQFAVLEINLTDSSSVQLHELNGYVQVTLPVPSNISVSNGKTIVVYRLEDDGSLTRCKTTVSNEKITFLTNHFSTYIIVEEKEDASPQMGDNLNLGIFMMMLLLVGTGFVFFAKKRYDLEILGNK